MAPEILKYYLIPALIIFKTILVQLLYEGKRPVLTKWYTRKTGMSDSNPSAGRTFIFKDKKSFQRDAVLKNSPNFTAQEPFYMIICQKISYLT